MAFHQTNKGKRSMELIALVDMVFVLLIFFILAFIVREKSFQEKGLYIPVPEEKYGQAQAMVQLLDDSRVFYLDEMDIEYVADLWDQNISPEQIKAALAGRNQITLDVLYERLDRLGSIARNHRERNFFIVIRSPGTMDYTRTMDIMARISNYGLFNMRYGCVGGSFEDLDFINCRPVNRNFGTYYQKTMQIDFISL